MSDLAAMLQLKEDWSPSGPNLAETRISAESRICEQLI
jgi:hypothetical protein